MHKQTQRDSKTVETVRERWIIAANCNLCGLWRINSSVRCRSDRQSSPIISCLLQKPDTSRRIRDPTTDASRWFPSFFWLLTCPNMANDAANVFYSWVTASWAPRRLRGVIGFYCCIWPLNDSLKMQPQTTNTNIFPVTILPENQI